MIRPSSLFLPRTAVAPLDARIAQVRLASAIVVCAFLALWLVRASQAPSIAALALLVGCVWGSIVYGSLFARLTSRLCEWHPGIAYELLVGFFVGNTLLFVLTLLSPLGMGGNLAVVASIAVLGVMVIPARLPLPSRSFENEVCSLVCIVFVGLAATLWVQDQQPLMSMRGGTTVFTVWLDLFIHVREISAFANGHGLSTISDIKLSGVPAQAYHFGSYMVPAALDALTSTKAIEAYAAFQLPFGLLLMGLAAYVFPAMAFRTRWPAVVASAVLVASPDAYQQGFGVHYLAFHFMSQVNLGMLYGIACICLAWIFMLEACRGNRLAGLAIAYAFLATCVTYKAHLFVANAMVMMLFPCLFFGTFRLRWRILGVIGVVVVFAAVVALSQRLERMPTLRLDLSGTRAYVNILMGGFSEGLLKAGFDWIYFKHQLPRLANAVLAGALIIFGSFGWWTFAGPIVVWKVRKRIEPRLIAFVALVVLNYMGMSMLLAMDEKGIGAPEEFLNRPHAWAWFVVVVFVTTMVAVEASHHLRAVSRRGLVVMASAGVALLLVVHAHARNLETFPEWEGHADYADFNTAPTCLVRAAQYLRENARIGAVIQDSQFDRSFVVTAIAERQAHVVDAGFGGARAVVAERVGRVKAFQASADESALMDWAKANHVAWYLLHPEDGGSWPASFLQQAVFTCDGWRVFKLN